MSHPLYLVDAFTDRAFAGNPAAVCVLRSPVRDPWMQAMAAELNQSETAFLYPLGTDVWQIRWFSPRCEVKLCGHATLASAHVLWRHQGSRAQVLSFATRSGEVKAARVGEKIALDFPAQPLQVAPIDAELLQMLAVEDPAMVRSCRLAGEDLLVELGSAEQVRRLQPDLALLEQRPVRGLIITAESDAPGVDFVSRFFAPRLGIDEDAVTGAAHCALAPYWAELLQRQTLDAFQCSRRGGALRVQLRGERVELLGSAVTTLEGTIHV